MAASIEHAPGELVDVRGHRLWVEREGAGPTLLMLTALGPAGSHVHGHPWGRRLADAFDVVYVDLHGRGRSDHPADLTEIDFAGDVADVAALVERLGGPVSIYGFSYGGLVAQALALDHPTLVDRLVLANTLHGPEMWQANHVNINAEIARQDPERWARVLALRGRGVRSTDAEMAAEFASAQPLVRFYDPGNAARLPSEPGSRNEALYRAFCGDDVDFIIGGRIPAIPDFRPRLRDLAIPALVLYGRYDRALYPALQEPFRRIPDAQVVALERSGAFGHIEEPDRVVEEVRTFLAAAGG